MFDVDESTRRTVRRMKKVLEVAEVTRLVILHKRCQLPQSERICEYYVANFARYLSGRALRPFPSFLQHRVDHVMLESSWGKGLAAETPICGCCRCRCSFRGLKSDPVQ
ncbi:hypothetical protein INR49_030159 [Caranx melampygus]|nr:hypothetical protein INR49_030159 [Caranx melampygus]